MRQRLPRLRERQLCHLHGDLRLHHVFCVALHRACIAHRQFGSGSAGHLACAGCGPAVPLGGGAVTQCLYCQVETPIPEDYRAVQRTTQAFLADRKLAEQLYDRVGRPPNRLVGLYLVALPDAWVRRVRAQEFRHYLSIDTALEAFREATERRWVLVFGLIFVFPLGIAMGWMMAVAHIVF